MADDLATRLAHNVKELRQARGMTQAQVSKLASLPRATWANLESGMANPTLGVLHSVAAALEVPLEELIASPRADVKLYPKGSLPSRSRGRVLVRSLLPDNLPNTQIERLELPHGARLIGVPHTPGTREYLTCESGEIELTTHGETLRLAPGDVAVFRGDQKHSYGNPATKLAVGYSVVLLKPAG
ncbi:MAG: helix-turn-helix transcriptional regulator [Myxococcales bacterium]|nr:helix-turn-helix transcriptional regulator [Myxococcales bacterium]